MIRPILIILIPLIVLTTTALLGWSVARRVRRDALLLDRGEDEEEDLEKSGCDVTVKADAPLKDVPEGSYAELAARLRKAFKEDDRHE